MSDSTFSVRLENRTKEDLENLSQLPQPIEVGACKSSS